MALFVAIVRRRRSCAAVVVLALAPDITLGQASFIGIGELAGGLYTSRALAVSGDGAVVVGDSFDERGPVAFRWTQATGLVSLGRMSPDDYSSHAVGVTVDGSTVGGTSGSFTFKWTEGGGFVPIVPAGLLFAAAMSADGSVIVGTGPAEGFIGSGPVRWNAVEGVVAMRNHNEHSVGGAWVVSSTGAAIYGTLQRPGSTSSFQWLPPDAVDTISSGLYSWIADTSADGTIAAGHTLEYFGGQQAFRWSAANLIEKLGALPGDPDYSASSAISDAGDIVFGRAVADPLVGPEAFIWDEQHGMRTLRSWLLDVFGLALNGWILRTAEDISADGSTIVGWGTEPCGGEQAWILRLTAPILTPPPRCEGDANGDRAVGFPDLNFVLSNFNGSGPCGDLNSDQAVNFDDLNEVVSAFHTACGQ
jgi:uncharacterized membrane protein